ncbi:MAG: YbgA family protein [Thermoanaerobaculia bacterium]
MSSSDLPKLRIGISACLLGQEVRYNGGHKRDAFLTDTLGPYVEWVAVCPEVEVGMGTPRPPIRLERRGEEIRLVMPSTGEDYTDAMRWWAERRVAALAAMDLDGYVLKKDSPSCGMERVKIYPGAGAPSKDGRGLFAEALIARLPDLPVEEEGRLNEPLLRENFIARVFVHHRWREGEREGWTRASLMRFHERHKFLLMARNQNGMRRLGRLLGDSGKATPAPELAAAYRRGLTEVLRRPAIRRGHTNVLQHLAGFVSDALDPADRAELAETIERYRLGLVPLIVPLTLIRHHVRRQGVEYLQGQAYLEPHPYELMLLNHV